MQGMFFVVLALSKFAGTFSHAKRTRLFQAKKVYIWLATEQLLTNLYLNPQFDFYAPEIS